MGPEKQNFFFFFNSIREHKIKDSESDLKFWTKSLNKIQNPDSC